MPSSVEGKAGEGPEQEGAAGAPLLRLPTAPDKGTTREDEDPQSKGRHGMCRCQRQGPDGDDFQKRSADSEAEAGVLCRKCHKNRGSTEESAESLAPGDRTRPTITFSHVEGGVHKDSEGRDMRSRSPSPLLEIPTPVDTSKEIMRPPSPTAERA